MSESRSSIPPLVLVTGATGFVGLHIVKYLMEKNYRIRGTVRNLNNNKKIEPLKALCPDNSRFPLQLFEADLLKDEGWSEAVFECDYVIHAAGHYPNDPLYDITKLIGPNVEGTLRVLKACAREASKKRLKRVVLTGTTLAVHGEPDVDESRIYNEDDWTDLTTPTVRNMAKCKTMAEKQSWDFVNGLPEDNKFEFTVVNGCLALGPLLSDFPSTSHQLLVSLMDRRKIPMLPHLRMCLCDVRDFANAHLRAMIVPEAAGSRHILVSANIWVKEMADILRDEFGPLGYSVSQTYAPYSFFRVARILDKSVDTLTEVMGKTYNFDSSKTLSSLGVEFKGIRSTIVDTMHSLIQKGLVKKTNEYKAHEKANHKTKSDILY